MQTVSRLRPETLRRCAICPARFVPRWHEQRTCGGPCARVLAGRTTKGRLPAGFAAAVRTRKIAKKQEIERLCQRRWPELSVREIEIFNFAVKVGYRRGYAKGYNGLKRGYRRTVAA